MDIGNTAVTAAWDALNVEHRGVCRGGDRLNGSTAGAVLCIERGTPRCLQGWDRLHGSTAGAVLCI